MSSTRKNAPSRLNIHSLHSAIDGISDYNTKIYTAAKWYAKHGFMIVPFKGNGKGYPKGLSQHHATCHEAKIDEWWHPQTGLYPGAIIAMAHGGESGFCAIDLDVKDGANGIDTLAELAGAYGDYNDGSSPFETLMATTPSGGKHLIFRYNPEIISNSEVQFSGIDTRGGLKRNPAKNGGITFVEPSRSIKPEYGDNNTYRWDDHGPTDIIEMPRWLIDTLNGRPPQRTGIQLQEAYIQSAPGLHGDGRDRNIYIDLLRFVGIGYTEEQLWGLMPQILERMDPPDEEMVRRKIESVLESEAFAKQQEKIDRVEKTASLDLDCNEKGKPLATTRNLDVILRSPIFEHGYGLIEYDEFQHQFIKDKKPLASVADYAVDIGIWISTELKLEYGFNVIRSVIEAIVHKKEHVNVAREYMEQCPPCMAERTEDYWGSGRLGPGPAFRRLCSEVLDLDNPKLHEGYTPEMRKTYMAQLWFWLQGVCARAYVPGCKMEMVLNIFGSQGIGKSTFFQSLCPKPEWFTDTLSDNVVGNNDNKDELRKLHGCLIAEMPELSPIKRGGKSSDDKFKHFISTQSDRFRAPFGKDTVDYKRTCALAGTSNNRDVYRDMTGDRRFLSIDHGSKPIRLGDVDNGVMDQIRDELWGEVRDSFRTGELYNTHGKLHVCIPPKLRKHQEAINSAHRYEEVGAFEILDWCKKRTRFTYHEIIAFGRSIPGLRDSKISEQQIMRLARNVLVQDGFFLFRKNCTITDVDGNKKRANAWVNMRLKLEQEWQNGDETPPHWSQFPQVKSENEAAEDEY